MGGTSPTADICSVLISLAASLHAVNGAVAAWFSILRASSLLVAASSLAASMPCDGESQMRLLLDVGVARLERCDRLQSSLVLRPILRIACSATFEGLLRWTSRAAVSPPVGGKQYFRASCSQFTLYVVRFSPYTFFKHFIC